jgi:membrane associated rhomboid family serine protease
MALADRTYMREEPSRQGWSVTVAILVLNVIIFFAEHANGRQSVRAFTEYGALSLEGLQRGYVWQLLTYQFLHNGLIHLVFNCLALFMFGRPVEMALGRKSFLKLYLFSGFAGAIVQLLLALLSPAFGGWMVGASAGICGLVAAFALLFPDSTIYVFFVLPVRAKYFLPAVIAFSVVFLFLPPESGSRGVRIAHGAHLGGTLLGVAYLRWFYVSGYLAWTWQWLRGPRSSRPIVKVRFPHVDGSRRETGRRPEEMPSADFISREVDPILEKISAHGIHSLTERERRILEAARERMEKR